MSRPRIDGINEKIIQLFIKKGHFRNHSDVITAALKLLVREQRRAESEMINKETVHDSSIYQAQIEIAEASDPHPVQRVARRSKRVEGSL